MLEAVPKQLARAVIRSPGPVLAAIGLLTVAAAAMVPHLEMDPSPRSLVSTYGDQEEASALLREHFGNTDHVVVVLVEAEDVLEVDALGAVRAISERLAAEPFAERVESLTETAVAVRRSPEDEVALPTLDTLDSLEDEDPLGTDLTPEVLAALEALIEAEPDRFPGGLASLSESAEAVEVRQVGDVIDRDEAVRLRSTIERVPMLSGRLVSRPDAEGKRHVAAVALFLKDEFDSHDEVSAAAKRVDELLRDLELPTEVRASAGGLPHLWVEIVDRMASDQRVLIPLTLIVCMLFLWVSFRWWPATVLPIVAVAITAVLALGTMAAAGEPLNVLNNIVPPLLIIIGVSDSIHLIGRYREELAAGCSRREATKRTMQAMTVACLLTSVTTAVGLASLLVSRTETLQHFGVSAATGVLIAYVVTILFLPSAILFVRAPSRLEPEGRSVDRDGAPADDRLERSVGSLTAWVLRRPWVVLAGGAIVAVGAGVTANRITVDTRLRDQFDEEDPVYETTMLMDRELDGVRPLELLVSVPPSADDLADPDIINGLDSVAEWAADQTPVLRASGPGEAIHEAWYLLTGDPEHRTKPFVTRGQIEGLIDLVEEPSGEFDQASPISTGLSHDRRVARLEIRVSDVGAQATMRLIDALSARVRRELRTRDDLTIYMTGDAFSGSVPIDSVVRDMLASLGLAVGLIFVLLSFLFRSVRLGLLAIPGNALPLIIGIAWMVLRDIPLNIATAIIFSISFGLAVDGTIHLLARFREERSAGKSLDDALIASARGTGRAIAVSSAVLMCGFSVLLFSAFVPVRYFGELVAVTVAGCLVATLVIQPALLKVGAPRRTAS